MHLNGGAAKLLPSFVLDTFANTTPLSRTNPEQIEEIRTWGRDRAVPAGRTTTTTTSGTSGTPRRVVFMSE
ncbi:hypothetical protein ACFV1W_33640 [Kitasatospora sp. NPDC059648]|uniref:hypothetical protein n=1 Tax=Kitasatospora sp. NPDC059648 TaxID=3346894 RepID=UPI0036B7365D